MQNYKLEKEEEEKKGAKWVKST